MSHPERLEVRLDSELRRKLELVATERGTGISETVRNLILETYEIARSKKRQEAARRIAELALEDVPDPDQLSAELDATHADAGLR